MTFTEAAVQDVQTLFKSLKTSAEKGLTREDVIRLQKQIGLNEIKAHQIGWIDILWRQLKSPFIFLLIFAAGASYFIEGNSNAFIIIAIVVLQTILGFYQEYGAFRTLLYLQNFVTASVKVIRDGQNILVSSKELVPGDVVVLIAGDVIPADIRFFKEFDLTVDESVLTGESIPVKKGVTPLTTKPTQPYQAENIGFSGTVVASGKGWGVVYATGKETVIGDIARLATTNGRLGIFEQSLSQFSRFILYLTVITVLVVFIAQLILKGQSFHITDLILFALALAVGITPDALPLVTTYAHARGANYLAKLKVIVKRLSAIDDLGSIQVLCVDKTGTLTENVLTMSDVYTKNDKSAVLYGALAALDWKVGSKKSENAIDNAFWQALGEQDAKMIQAYEKVVEIPFDPQRRCNTLVVKHEGSYELIVRGMVEAVSSFCQGQDCAAYVEWARQQGTQGKRVIAVASKKLPAGFNLDQVQNETTGLQMLGAFAFNDPIKKTVPAALARARELGIEVKIISGDAPEVVGAVAHQLNLLPANKEVMTGEKFETLSPQEQKEAAYTYSVFARIRPQGKYAIIQSLQEKYRVGYLGDGINDAPALKLADVGLVVQGASDVAREAADIILLKKSLHVIVDGIQEGRVIFLNTIKYVRIVLAANTSNLYSIALASLVVNFLPMLPIQILLLNLLADLALVAIATDHVDAGELQKPIEFSMRGLAFVGLVLGLVNTLFDFIFFAFFFHAPAAVIQTNWFIESMLTILVFIFSARTALPFYRATLPSWQLVVSVFGAAFFGIALPFTQFGQTYFSFVLPQQKDLLIIASIVLCYFITTEIVKHLYYYITTQARNKGK